MLFFVLRFVQQIVAVREDAQSKHHQLQLAEQQVMQTYLHTCMYGKFTVPFHTLILATGDFNSSVGNHASTEMYIFEYVSPFRLTLI